MSERDGRGGKVEEKVEDKPRESFGKAGSGMSISIATEIQYVADKLDGIIVTYEQPSES
jgi:hypothetical protein